MFDNYDTLVHDLAIITGEGADDSEASRLGDRMEAQQAEGHMEGADENIQTLN